ncbi:FHA domain-containing protein [Enorma burkinafasonensis]|uniref:FHA domain-containing protein n=1 Tax=Enorma burkinafasonensis TaxID=2590867 RepID=UPI0016436EF3|nr:FHA domain-containing protein [Enorma burkinafasonensis]
MNDLTPCGAMFTLLKRKGGLSNREVAGMVLSSRPLSDGKSPVSRIGDRTWVSRFVVHAPVGSLQERYFRDYGVAAQRVFDRLRSGRRHLSNQQVIELILDRQEHLMEQALEAQHQSAVMYRHAVERILELPGESPGERAEMLMVLFIATGCSGQVRSAVAYTLDYAKSMFDARPGTPPSEALDVESVRVADDAPRPLGLLRLRDGLVMGGPYWIDPAGAGAEVGALATGAGDVSDVEGDVSARHVRICRDAEQGWRVEDLGSTNGTVLTDASTGAEQHLDEGAPVPLHAGDELRLGAATVFVVIEGEPR